MMQESDIKRTKTMLGSCETGQTNFQEISSTVGLIGSPSMDIEKPSRDGVGGGGGMGESVSPLVGGGRMGESVSTLVGGGGMGESVSPLVGGGGMGESVSSLVGGVFRGSPLNSL